MFDKRLFQLAPGLGKLIAGKVALMWVGLLANIGFMLSLVMLLQGLLAAADPHTFSCNAASASECPANLFGVPGTTVAPMAGDLMVYVALAIVCMLVRYLATTHATRLGTEAAERVKLALRSKLYRKMVALGPSYRSRVKTSDVVQSAGEGVEQIQSFFELFLPQLFYAILAPITLFAVIAPINMPAAVTMLVCAPLIIIVTGIVSMTAARAFKKYWGRYTDMGAAFLDNLQGLETLKNFDADDRAAAGWSPVMLAAHLPGAFAYLAYGLQYLMPFGAGFPLTLAGLLLIVLLSAEFFIPMRQLGSYFHVAMNGMTSTKRIFALLDTPEPAHGTATLPATAGTDAGTDAGTKAGAKADGGITVSFDHVGYSYDSADSGAAVQQTNSAPAPALTDLTFTAYPGQLTAIVGISGSGKSTAAALLAGTLTGYQGSLTLNGVKVSDLSGETLARTITLIGASSHLFAGTLRENLLMALPDDGQNGDAASDAVDSRLWDALEQARIADFVRSQQDGLGMTIEPDAANLSGGQRQRIAIARALLHDSPVFVFDEATSSVDVESEELILATIRELVQSRSKTVIMITHRMANAEHADQVVVLEHGKSVEAGTHAELMAAGGVYAKLFTTQADIENFGGDNPQPASLTASASGSGAAVGAAPAAAPAEMSTFQVIKRLLGEAKPLAGLMVAASTAGTIGHLAATFLPVFGIIAGFALAGNPVWGMSAAGAITAMIVCAVLRGLTRYVEQYLNHNVAFHLLALFRSKAFAALRRLAPAKLAGKGKGDLIAMLTTDVELLEIFFAHTISPVAIAVTTTIVYAIVAATLSPWMALALIVSHLIIGIIVPRFFATGVRNLGPAIRGAAGELDNVMLDDMRGLDEIIRFGRGEDRAQAIEDRTRALWRDHAKLSRVNGRFAGVGGLLVALLTSAAAGIAINLVGVNLYDIPALVAAFALLVSSFGPTLALAALPANLTQTFASARRLFGLMDEAPAVVETGTANSDYEGMRLDRVTFAYPGEESEAILADFSLDVPQHGILGIQGPSGRGKSTMLKLLMRYWDPQRGQVTLSGTPLPQIDVHARRRIQAMMSQETHLFDGTIRENLLIALPESEIRNGGAAGVLDARLREALAKASVLDLIDFLPDGLDTQVGELGDRLSEGERQRIGLARVFLRNADLVLFDEPTSRLDALNEAIILRSIHELSKSEQNADKGQDVAVVLVSHRESAMRVADAVLNL